MKTLDGIVTLKLTAWKSFKQKLIFRCVTGPGLALGLIVSAIVTDTSLCANAEESEAMELAVRISNTPVLYQNLVWVGNQAPGEMENRALLSALDKLRQRRTEDGTAELEKFLTVHTNSPWHPSIEANLARYYREHGSYTKALKYWESAWYATHEAREGPAKQVADFTFAHWTRLLASLGRVDTLGSLFKQTADRTFDAGPLQQIINGTREAWQFMQTEPGGCFKCGTFALNHVALKLKPSFTSRELVNIPSPASGFSMSKLMEIAKQENLDLVPARWSGEKQLVLPSVVHWKQNHYAALLEQRGELYLVLDPTFGRPKWLTRKIIEEETSGVFLVPKSKLPSDWKVLSQAETEQIFGRGSAYGIYDPSDGCGNGGGGGSPPDTDMAGSSCSSCAEQGGNSGATGGSECCADGLGNPGQGGNANARRNNSAGGGLVHAFASTPGMPIWQVSEPYITTWLYDVPLKYDPGLGQSIIFKLAYKQRETRSLPDNVFSLGKLWDCSWVSYILMDGQHDLLPTLILPGGGERSYFWPEGSTGGQSSPEYYSGTKLERDGNELDVTTNYTLVHPTGARDDYSFIPSAQIDGKDVAFLTRQTDPFGHATRFIYQETQNAVKLLQVIDADGRTNTLLYDNVGFSNRITGVTDPFGRTAILQYDATGMLTNITDVAQITNSFKYDSQGWITNLITPYGTTTFLYATNNESSTSEFLPVNSYRLIRAVKIIDPAGGTNIYMLRQNCEMVYTNATDLAPFLSQTYNPAAFPTDVPALLYNNLMQYRNTFHWGPRQATGLPDDMHVFSPSDLRRARMRHWLHDPYDPSFVGQSLSMQLDPSPDGVVDGQSTWFGYEQAGGPFAGATPFPTLVARILPDTTTWYTWYQRDKWGRPTNIVQTYSSGYGVAPLTRTNSYVYDANEVDLLKEIGPLGETLHSYGYDTFHQLIRATNAVGDIASFVYDSAGRLTFATNEAGLTTMNIYYSSGEYANWVQQRIDLEIGRANSFTYTNDLILTHTDERGTTTTFAYDNLQRPTSITDGRGSIFYSYDKLDLIQSVDRMGRTNKFAYDNVRRLVALTNALGNYTLYNYCTCGSLDSVRDAEGKLTQYRYDNAGRLLNTIYPDNYSLTNVYDLAGRLIISIDSGGMQTTNWFDNQGLVYAVNNAAGIIKATAFDIEDRPVYVTDARGVTVTNTFDTLGRVLTRAYPDQGLEKFGYSARGLIAYTNQIGASNFFAYDEAGRKVSETDANNEIIRYTNNAASDLLSLTDGKNQITRWNYDEYGRVTNKLDQSGAVILRYKYDATDRLTNRWSTAKGDTYYSYDAVGNLTFINYPSGPDVSFGYDAVTRLTNMVDAVGTTKYSYTAAGQLLTEDGPFVSDTVTNTYVNRLRTALSLQQPTGAWTNGFAYDAVRRMTNVTSQGGSFGYQLPSGVPAFIPIKVSLPNTAYITNVYDVVSRVLSTRLNNSGDATLDSYAYVYDPANERTNLARTDASTVAYSYDKIGQLKVADSSVSTEDRGYFYDAAWNLNFRTNNGSTTSFTVNSKNQLMVAAGATCTYDGNGNLIQKGTSNVTGYEYDAENQLIVVTNKPPIAAPTPTGGWKGEFTYDGLGRLRIRKDYYGATSAPGGWFLTNTTWYVYDGRRVIQERNSGSTPVVSYTRGIDLSGTLEGAGGIGGLLGRSHGYSAGNWSTHNTYFADGNGNVTYMLDSNQAMVASYRYDPFGNTISKNGSLADANLYRFSSKEIHVNSGMYYYGYRWYDPNLQRWLNRDPIGERGGINLYTASLNSLIDHNDPLGLIPGHENDPPTVTLVGPPLNPPSIGAPRLPPPLGSPQPPIPPQGGTLGGPVDWGDPGNIMPGQRRICSSPQKSPCPPGQHQEQYWQIMGYPDRSTCATAEWQLNRECVTGIGGTIIGGLVCSTPAGSLIGAAIGGGLGAILIPNAICNSWICVTDR